MSDDTSNWTAVLDFATEEVLVRQVPGYRRALALADALLTATKETP